MKHHDNAVYFGNGMLMFANYGSRVRAIAETTRDDPSGRPVLQHVACEMTLRDLERVRTAASRCIRLLRARQVGAR